MKQVVSLAAAALLCVSCAPAPAPAESAATRVVPSTAPSAAPPRPRAEKSDAEEALQRRLAGALAYVSGIRNLAAKAPVQGRLIGHSEIERYISAQIDEETPKDVLEATEA